MLSSPRSEVAGLKERCNMPGYANWETLFRGEVEAL
jgi:hypothetical protein